MIYPYKGNTPNVHPQAYIAPGAKIIGNVEIGEDSTVWFHAVLRGDDEKIIVGRGTNIQDGVIIHLDPGYPVVIGDRVTVGHQVTLHGCTIEDEALIGVGATVLNGAIIGRGALVAAGALVTEGMRVEPGMLVAGVPAKPLRKLTEEQIARSKAGVQSYIDRGKIYQAEHIK